MKLVVSQRRPLLRCPYCRVEIAARENWATCETCSAQHHASCWAETEQCAACQGTLALTRFVARPQQRTGSSRLLLVRASVLALTGVLLASVVGWATAPPPDERARLRDRANGGDVAAMVALAQRVETSNPWEAAAWLQIATKRGDPDAMFALGDAYAVGRGVDADPAAAEHWWRHAAAADHPEAMLRLANLPPRAAIELDFGGLVDSLELLPYYTQPARDPALSYANLDDPHGGFTSRVFLNCDPLAEARERENWLEQAKAIYRQRARAGDDAAANRLRTILVAEAYVFSPEPGAQR